MMGNRSIWLTVDSSQFRIQLNILSQWHEESLFKNKIDLKLHATHWEGIMHKREIVVLSKIKKGKLQIVKGHGKILSFRDQCIFTKESVKQLVDCHGVIN